MSEIIDILNMPIIQFIIVAVPVTLISLKLGGKFIKERYNFFVTKEKLDGKRKGDLHTIGGKIRIALQNPDIAREKVMKDIKEAKILIESTDKNIVAQGKSKLSSAELEEKVLNFIAEHRSKIEFMGEDAVIDTIEGIETKARKFAKGMVGNFI